MVKGNKFKTVEFLKKQALKLQPKPPAIVITALQQQPAPHGHSGHPVQVKSYPPGINPLHASSQAKAGSKRKRPKGALAEVVNASVPVAAQQTAHIDKNQQQVMEQKSAPPPKSASNAPGPKKRRSSKPALPTILAAPAPQGKAVNSNWAALKGLVASKTGSRRQANANPAADRPPALKAPKQIGSRAGLTPVIALDCEMVGVGPDGIRSALARVCMVNNDGGVLLDQYVRPAEKVTDYRTFVSGIEPAHLKEGAVSLAEAQQKVAQILTGRVLVGHAVHHDLQALLLSHPRKMTRDTATYPPLMMSIGKRHKSKPRALRHLAETELGLRIQAGEHSPIDDARSALYLYHKHRKDWERHLQNGTLKDLEAPRLQKKIVMQQIKEAAAAGLDADLIKDPSTGRKQQSLAKLAEHDDMVDL